VEAGPLAKRSPVRELTSARPGRLELSIASTRLPFHLQRPRAPARLPLHACTPLISASFIYFLSPAPQLIASVGRITRAVNRDPKQHPSVDPLAFLSTHRAPDPKQTLESNRERNKRCNKWFNCSIPLMIHNLYTRGRDANMGHVCSKRCEEGLCLLTNQST
jgi:hypothetical protein